MHGGQATDDQTDTLAKGWKMDDKGLMVVKVISSCCINECVK